MICNSVLFGATAFKILRQIHSGSSLRRPIEKHIFQKLPAGGTGTALVEVALRKGYTVRAFVRSRVKLEYELGRDLADLDGLEVFMFLFCDATWSASGMFFI